jgi:hypothetical protein
MMILTNGAHPVLTTPATSALEAEEQSIFPDPTPARVRLGHLTLINDNEAFMQAFASSIEMYYEDEQEYEQRTRTVQDLCRELLEILTAPDIEMELSWRLGFAAGRIAGLLNPDLAEAHPRIDTLETLSRKCAVLYPGPNKLSMYIGAAHKAACIDTVPLEGLPARGKE